MIFIRQIEAEIIQILSQKKSKIIVLYGPRQVGKTTLVKTIFSQLSKKSVLFTTDDREISRILSSQDLNQLRLLTAGYDIVCIDEAQRIENIGLTLKLMYDNMPELKIIATGSSSFDLANKIKEPLTGRTRTYTLFPIALKELDLVHSPYELDRYLDAHMVYGGYPDVVVCENQTEKIRDLNELSSSYLYQDILELKSIKYANKLQDLLKLLAFQIGSEVSLSELGQQLEMNKDTIAHYIDLLEKSFVVFRLSGFSRNLRKEVTKMDKIYFYDLGIRNSLIQNFSPLNLRADRGALWENMLIIERLKQNAYQGKIVRSYFWRIHTGAELDYIEESGAELSGYEFKFSRKISKSPSAWTSAYPEAHFDSVSRDTYRSFLNLK